MDQFQVAIMKLEMIQDGLAQVRIEAVDLDQLDKLVEYYADKEHPGLRIRRYHRGIPAPRREMDLNLVRFLPYNFEIFTTDFQRVKI